MFSFYKCVRQYDSSDCACACIATIAQCFGEKISLATIREYMDIREGGISVYEICKMADKIGFSTTALKKTEEFNKNKLIFPCIAHVYQEDGSGHFVVLHKIDKKQIIIADPAIGIIKIPEKIFFDSIYSESCPYIWTGFIIILKPNSKFGKTKEFHTERFKNYKEILFLERKRIVKIVFLSVISLIISVITSFYFGIIVDKFIPNQLIYTLLFFSFLIIGLVIIKIALDWYRAQESLKLSQTINMKLCLDFYSHVLHLPLSFFDYTKSGEIISRLQDVAHIQEALIVGVLVLPVDAIFIVISGIFLRRKSILMFLAVFVMCICYCFVVWIFREKYIVLNSLLRLFETKVTTHLVDSIEGIQTIKAYTYENKMYSEGKKRIMQWQNEIFDFGCVENLQNVLKALINSVGEILVLCFGAYEVINGKISIGELITCNILIGYVLLPLRDIINLQPLYYSAQIATERLDVLLNIKEEEKKSEVIKELKSLIFKGISFGFDSYTRVLENINLSISIGDMTAIVGDTSSGKTTLAKLLMKFYLPIEGAIIFNNTNLDSLSIEYIRKIICYVSQEDFIFTGKVRDNLTLGNSDINDEQMISICKKLGVDEFVRKMEKGYDSILEERGKNLSKGQRQKISLARAVLKKPEILILDEATSNIDVAGEKRILSYLRNQTKMTLILISHRLESIIDSDNIYVLSHGKIVANGTHKELEKNCELYKNYIKGV